MTTPVILPKYVADALEAVRKEPHCDDNDYLLWLIPQSDKDSSANRIVLRNYVEQFSFINIIKAVLHGYEVEKTIEEKLWDGLGDLIFEWLEKGRLDGPNILRRSIKEFVVELYKNEGGKN